MIRVLLFLFVLPTVIPCLLSAEPADQPVTEKVADPKLVFSGSADDNSNPPGINVGWFDYVKMIFWLVFIILLIFILVKIVKSVIPGVATSSSGLAIVLERTPLNPKQCLYLVKIGKRVLVIGSSSDSLHQIAEIDDGAEVERLVQESSLPRAPKFQNFLKKASLDNFEKKSDVEYSYPVQKIKDDLDSVKQKVQKWMGKGSG